MTVRQERRNRPDPSCPLDGPKRGDSPKQTQSTASTSHKQPLSGGPPSWLSRLASLLPAGPACDSGGSLTPVVSCGAMLRVRWRRSRAKSAVALIGSKPAHHLNLCYLEPFLSFRERTWGRVLLLERSSEGSSGCSSFTASYSRTKRVWLGWRNLLAVRR